MMSSVTGYDSARPFRETHLDPSLRIPRSLAVTLGAALALGPIAAMRARRAPTPVRVLRGILRTSTAAYAIAMALDTAEHFRLEKAATGRYLRWTAVPPLESALHAGILASFLAAAALARRPPRSLRAPDAIALYAPAAFLAIGELDELVYHRRRAPLREEIIHATEHIAEGMMWTALYALRFLTRRRFTPIAIR